MKLKVEFIRHNNLLFGEVIYQSEDLSKTTYYEKNEDGSYKEAFTVERELYYDKICNTITPKEKVLISNKDGYSIISDNCPSLSGKILYIQGKLRYKSNAFLYSYCDEEEAQEAQTAFESLIKDINKE